MRYPEFDRRQGPVNGTIWLPGVALAVVVILAGGYVIETCMDAGYGDPYQGYPASRAEPYQPSIGPDPYVTK